MNTKKCYKCELTKSTEEFNIDKRNKDGFFSYCKPCSQEIAAIFYKRNKDRIKKLGDIWKANNPEKVKQHTKKWRDNNAEFVKSNAKEYYKNNPEKFNKNWTTENPGKSRSNSAKQNAKLYGALVEGTDYKKIQEFYIDCPEDMKVKHIVPCYKGGLHILENLQYVPKL